MAMHILNASSGSVVSCLRKHNCTLECAAGIKMDAPHSLPVVAQDASENGAKLKD